MEDLHKDGFTMNWSWIQSGPGDYSAHSGYIRMLGELHKGIWDRIAWKRQNSYM